MISVVIPTLNEEFFIENCLRSIRTQSLLSEIIVVDGGSNDRTVYIAKAIADEAYNLGMRGIGIARDYGTRASKGDIIVSADGDAVYQDGWLEALTKHFSDPEVVATGGTLKPMKPSLLAGMFAEGLTLIASSTNKFVGSNMAFRKSAFLEVGGYKHVTIGEDWDLCLRLGDVGKLVFEPDAVCVVDVPVARQVEILGLVGAGMLALGVATTGTFK